MNLPGFCPRHGAEPRGGDSRWRRSTHILGHCVIICAPRFQYLRLWCTCLSPTNNNLFQVLSIHVCRSTVYLYFVCMFATLWHEISVVVEILNVEIISELIVINERRGRPAASPWRHSVPQITIHDTKGNYIQTSFIKLNVKNVDADGIFDINTACNQITWENKVLIAWVPHNRFLSIVKTTDS